MSRGWVGQFGHVQRCAIGICRHIFSLCNSFKITIIQTIPEINSSLILVKFPPTKAKMYVVYMYVVDTCTCI
jgi:hypothetical protein